MNIYESLASAIITDKGGHTFVSSSYWGRSDAMPFWHWVLVAFGEGIYELPAKYRLTLPSGLSDYHMPGAEIRKLLALGFRPREAFTYRNTSGLRDSSPINVATALLKYAGPEHREAALTLLEPSLLMKAYEDAYAVSDFVQPPKHVNPHKPQDFGLERLPYSAFVRNGHFHAVDGISCAAWFEPEYLQHVFNHANPLTWFNTLLTAHERDPNFWEPYLRGGARRLLRSDVDSAYKKYSKYLHYVGHYEARDWLRRQRGAQALLWATLSDATPEEMAKGLKVMATGSSAPVAQAISLIGRSLTIADFRELTPLQALRILYNAPFACVEEVTRQHGEELGGMFFALTSHLQMVTDCMVNHTRRGRWTPATETAANRGDGSLDSWDTWAKQVVADHVSALSWRTRLLEACEPAVAFLAVVLQFGKTRANEMPLVAVESVLQSHPHMEAVMEIVQEAPASVQRLLATTK